MGWLERRCKHVVSLALFAATVVSTGVVATPAAASPRVPGIDVSKYQGRIDWGLVGLTPVRFVIMRATLGNRYRDGRFTRNVAGARRNGLTVGAYHFAKPGPAPWDPRAEADHFLDVVGLRAGDVVPVLDIEETGGLGPRQLRTWAAAWLRRVEDRTGVRAMIYSGNHFWHGFMRNTSWFADRDHPLWVAHWYVASPDVPGGRWGDRGFTVWQFSARGRIPGIRGPVDLDWMRGDLGSGTVASLDVRPADGGVIRADRIACGGRLGFCSRLINPGDAITLRAIPAEGSRLVRWTGACAQAGEARACRVTTFGRMSVSAVFGPPIEPEAPEAPSASTPPAPPANGSTRAVDDSDAPAVQPTTPTPQPTPTPRPTSEPPPSLAPAPSRVPASPRAPEPGSAPEGDGDGTRFAWSRGRDRHAIGGSYRWERRSAASISFGFRGGSVTLFTAEGRQMGKARISVDGESVRIIDGYARRFRPRVRHRFTGLGAGPHRLTITPLGRSRRGATDRRVTLDALRWGGRLHPDPKPEAASWARVEDPSASEGGYVVSDAPGAQAHLRFSGTSLTLMTLRGPARGRAEVWVDGRRVRTIDLYAPERRFASIRVASGLAEGPHTAKVVVLGSHHGASAGSGVVIDRWVVTYRPERGRTPNAHGRSHG